MGIYIGKVIKIESHPESDKLDVVTIQSKSIDDKISTYINVANRPEPNTPRYKVGDTAIILVDNLILPEWLLKHLDMWNEEKNKGGLAGNKGNRTKGRKISGVMSEVALCSVHILDTKIQSDTVKTLISIPSAEMTMIIDGYVYGKDFSEWLGITEYNAMANPPPEKAIQQ